METVRYLGPGEAARRLAVSTQTIRSWLAAGMLTGERTSIGHLVDAVSVQRLARDRAARPRRGRQTLAAQE